MPQKIVDYQEDIEVGHRDDCKCSEDRRIPGESADGQGKGAKKIAAAAKAFRALTAIIVFGVPLVTGTAALLAYGVHKACKRMTGPPGGCLCI